MNVDGITPPQARLEFEALVAEGRAWCYNVMYGGRVVIVVADHAEYFSTTFEYSSHVAALEFVTAQNDRIGLSTEQVVQIVSSSFRIANRRQRA